MKMSKLLYWLWIITLLTITACQSNPINPTNSTSPNTVVNFFNNHTWLTLVGWAMFPRIMFWFFSAITGGFWFWVGVLFVPRVMVAYWATTYYWHTNPYLCVIAWIVALGGESSEKKTISRR